MRSFGKQQSELKIEFRATNLPPKSLAAIEQREKDVINLVNTWTRLRLIQKLPPRVQILHELINDRFEVTGGTDALAFNRIDDLTQEFEEKINEIKGNKKPL